MIKSIAEVCGHIINDGQQFFLCVLNRQIPISRLDAQVAFCLDHDMCLCLDCRNLPEELFNEQESNIMYQLWDTFCKKHSEQADGFSLDECFKALKAMQT